VIGWWLAGCALRGVPHYDSVTFELEAPTDDVVAVLPDWVRRDLDRGRLAALSVDDEPVSVAELGEVPTPLLYAVFSLNKGWARSAELDLWVPHDGQRWPVTVRFDQGRGADAQLGEPTTGEPCLAPPEGLLVSGDRTWAPTEVCAVGAAWGALTEAEGARLPGLTLRRMATSRRAPGRELAWFDPTTEPPVIDVYDLAFADTAAFVGPVHAPLPLGALTVVHEIGHALADAPLRAAWLGDAPVEGRGGPVIGAWRAMRLGPGPTPYANKSAHEAFAEAFALYKLDPEALQRAMPEAVAFFAAGGHLPAGG